MFCKNHAKTGDSYAPFYDTLKLSTLSEMFSLPPRRVSAIISQMISHEDLAAALDQVSDAIIFRKGVDLSRLQSLSLALADRAASLIEQNEKSLEQRTQGALGGAYERVGGASGGQRGRGERGGRGGKGGGQGRGAGLGGGRRGQGFQGGALGRTVQA